MSRLLLKLRIRRDKEIVKRLATQDITNNLDIMAKIIIKTLSILKSKDLNSKDYLKEVFNYIPSNRIEVVNFKINLLNLVIF